MIRRALLLVLAVLVTLPVTSPAVPAGAQGADPAPVDGLPEDAPDELSPEEDNAAEGHDTCGGEPVSEAGSEVHRKLVDGPRRPDGTLAFTSGVCIYLPPGYRDGTQRYPVLYLLHGAFGWQDDWVVQGDAQAILDRVRAADAAADLIVVMPDGDNGAVWRDSGDGQTAVESYVIDHVIPYVDTHFRTIADRRGRAMSGLSNGGAGTLRMAAHHPDLFGVVTAMSPATPVNTGANRASAQDVWNDPTEVAANLNEVELALIWGLTCGTPEECQANAGGYAFELACCGNELYRARLDLVRERAYRYEATDGAHTWYFWQRWLEFSHGEFLREHLADPMPVDAELPPLEAPASFDFRSVDPVVSIYDHTVTTDPARPREFLTLTDVTADGLTIAGSGPVQVETAARYVPSEAYRVAGTGLPDADVIADDEGRLTFEVDLGPVSTATSPTAVLNAVTAGAAGATSRTVTIAAA